MSCLFISVKILLIDLVVDFMYWVDMEDYVKLVFVVDHEVKQNMMIEDGNLFLVLVLMALWITLKVSNTLILFSFQIS
jgi:hypothetical protein